MRPFKSIYLFSYLDCTWSLFLCPYFLSLQQTWITLQLRCTGFSLKWLLIEVASLVAEPGLQTLGLSSCSAWAQVPSRMWNLLRPGIKPMSLALAGRILTTSPPGKSEEHILKQASTKQSNMVNKATDILSLAYSSHLCVVPTVGH